ncbi:hypothetical protein C8J56DRAFT_31031 [Mycena floridula]|nr:hypothetical protein C8J56DRAFT_31031 [Mycena floridula]
MDPLGAAQPAFLPLNSSLRCSDTSLPRISRPPVLTSTEDSRSEHRGQEKECTGAQKQKRRNTEEAYRDEIREEANPRAMSRYPEVRLFAHYAFVADCSSPFFYFSSTFSLHMPVLHFCPVIPLGILAALLSSSSMVLSRRGLGNHYILNDLSSALLARHRRLVLLVISSTTFLRHCFGRCASRWNPFPCLETIRMHFVPNRPTRLNERTPMMNIIPMLSRWNTRI